MKHEKLYKKSPRLERGSDGEMGIKKPSEADAESMGTSGGPLPTDGDGEMPVQVKEMHDRHQTETKDMHSRHQEEMKDMHKRHQKEIKKHAGGPADKEEVK